MNGHGSLHAHRPHRSCQRSAIPFRLAFRHDKCSLSARRRMARVVRLKSIEMARAVFPSSMRDPSRASSSGVQVWLERRGKAGSLEPAEGEYRFCAVCSSFMAWFGRNRASHRALFRKARLRRQRQRVERDDAGKLERIARVHLVSASRRAVGESRGKQT
jgi:hypothetical protein